MMGFNMRFKRLVIAAVILVILLLAFTFFANNNIIKLGNYNNITKTALQMNALYQLENDYYSQIMQNMSVEHFGSGPLYDNPNATGYIIIKKKSSNCYSPLGNITVCSPVLLAVNTQVKSNNSGVMQLSTRVYRSAAEAKKTFSSMLSAIKSAENNYSKISVDDSSSLGSDVGVYENEYAVFDEPKNNNGMTDYIHILLLRRDNIVLTSLVINTNQSYLPKISRLTQSTEKMTGFLNDYLFN